MYVLIKEYTEMIMHECSLNVTIIHYWSNGKFQ